jgi:hypothetical protein
MMRAVVGILRVMVIGAILMASAAWAEDAARFVKLDGAGQPLPADAAEWAMVLDNKTALVWEIRTADGGSRDLNQLYTWAEAEKEYVPMLNQEQFGGFSDWRLPTRDELFTIRAKEQLPNVDPAFFPHTAPSLYWSFYICGDGSFITKKIAFGAEKADGKAHVRAVRGGSGG